MILESTREEKLNKGKFVITLEDKLLVMCDL